MTRSVLHQLGVTAAAMVLLSSCSGGSGAAGPSSSTTTSAPTTSSVPSATPAPMPTAWTRAEAAAEYEAIAASTRRDDAALSAVLDSTDLAKIHSVCKANAKSNAAAMTRLAAGRWPANVQGDVDDVLANWGALQSYVRQCSTVASVEDFQAIPLDTPHKGASQALRAKLGILS